MDQRAWLVAGLGVVSLLAGGCQSVGVSEADEGDVAEARQAQIPINPDKAFTLYQFAIDSNPLFDLLVIGDTSVDGYQADTEYWYVHASALGALGAKDIEVTSTSGDVDPPSLSGDQEFTQPVYLTWQSFSTDPVSAGNLYGNTGGDHYLRVKVESGEVTRLVWYQIISNQSPANVAPRGTYSPISGSVTVPSGEYGYHVDAAIE